MTGDLGAIIETGGAAAAEIAASSLIARGGAAPTGKCANCTSSLLGPYCAVCGQPTDTHRRSVHGLVNDFVVDVVNFDSRILRTARALLFEPGELPRAFRQGRTQPFVPAIRLYLFVSLIFFVLLSFTHIALFQMEVTATPTKVVWVDGKSFIANPAYDKDEDDPDVRRVMKPMIPISKDIALKPGGVWNYSTNPHFFARMGIYHSKLSPQARDALLSGPAGVSTAPKAARDWLERNIYDNMAKIAADPAALNTPITNWLPRALFLLLPLYALLLGLFHIRRRDDFYLVDHLVFSLSIHTFTFVALMGAVLLAQVLDGETVAWIVFGVLSLYIFLAMKRFYEQGWVMTTVKFVFISGIYTTCFLFPALLTILALSVFGVDFG
jgi:hypothetical protein